MHKCATLRDIPDLKNLFGKKWSKERTILEMNKDKKDWTVTDNGEPWTA